MADRYLSGIRNPKIQLPKVSEHNVPVWHIFAIRVCERESLLNWLREGGISTVIHYPVPIHLQAAYSNLGFVEGDFPIAEQIAVEEVSLPMFYGITDEQVDWVIERLNTWE